MHHPYQCLATCRPGEDSSPYLLAASGHKLFSISLDDGTIASKWQIEEAKKAVEDETPKVEQTEEPPSKKRRLSTIAREQDPPNIIKLAVTRSHTYAVAVTAEDKAIRVFSISPAGELTHLSSRTMPKRPCAIAFTPDEQEILSADKFGDVYSLPLLVDPEREAEFLAAQKAAAEAKQYVPAATELTVHSKANRKALETQLLQAKEKAAKAPKESFAFSHKLLLGHVSMLTDMLVTTLRHSEDDERTRTYILTADRDEHIRVSRGPPQTHVIEGYCLGHHEFISKLCLAEQGLLVSGGGENVVLVWDWLNGSVVNRIDILEVVKRARIHIRQKKWVAESTSREETEAEMTEVEEENKELKIAISGIWLFEDTSMETEPQLLITVEGLPAVLHIPVASLRSDKASDDMSFICLDGNALDIGLIGDALIVSTDNIHRSGSTTDIDTRETYKPRLQAFQAVGEELGGGAVFKPYLQVNNTLNELNGENTADWHEKALQNLLYNIENLRKRGGQDESAAE